MTGVAAVAIAGILSIYLFYFNFYFYISLKEFFPFHGCVTDYHLIDIATSLVIVI